MLAGIAALADGQHLRRTALLQRIFDVIDSDSDWFEVLAPQLRIAVAVLEEQHITRAAHRLGVPQPTVTSVMRRIGASIGAPLVQRSGRRVVRTAAGRAFLPAAQNALRSLAVARQEVGDVVDPDHGRVALGFAHGRGSRDVPMLIDAFLAAHPDITFELHASPRDELIDHMHNCAIDVAIVAPVPADPRLESVTLGDERLYLVVDIRHRLAGRHSVTLREAAGESFIVFTAPHGLRHVFDRLCDHAGFRPTLAFQGQEIATLRGLIRAGLGVGLLPRSLHPEPGIAEIPISSPDAHREVGAVWIKDRQVPPATKSFITFLKDSGARVLAEPFGVVGLHSAVLGKPGLPG